MFYRLHVQVNTNVSFIKPTQPAAEPSNICRPRRRWRWPDTDCPQRRWCWNWRCCRRLWSSAVRRWSRWTGWRWDQWRCCWSSGARWSECFWRWSCVTERPTPSEWRPWSGSHLQGQEEKVWWFKWNLNDCILSWFYFVYRRVLFFFSLCIWTFLLWEIVF